MKVLGLDLSLKSTGICILDGDKGSTSPSLRTELFPQPKVDSVKEKIRRLVLIAERIIQLINGENPDFVIIEAPAKNQVWQAAAIGEVHGVVKVQIYLASGIVPIVKEATEMRKVVVGKIERKTVSVVGKDGKKTKKVSYGEIDGSRGKKKATVKDLIEIRLAEKGLKFPSQDEMDAYVAAKYCWDKIASSEESIFNDQEAKQRIPD